MHSTVFTKLLFVLQVLYHIFNIFQRLPSAIPIRIVSMECYIGIIMVFSFSTRKICIFVRGVVRVKYTNLRHTSLNWYDCEIMNLNKFRSFHSVSIAASVTQTSLKLFVNVVIESDLESKEKYCAKYQFPSVMQLKSSHQTRCEHFSLQELQVVNLRACRHLPVFLFNKTGQKWK